MQNPHSNLDRELIFCISIRQNMTIELSIVSTMYHSASYLAEFYRRISETAAKLTDQYEIILVNDGSPDDSLPTALSLHEKDHRVRVVDLSRNFGHHKAIMTGLAHARGKLVFLIDCDLEELPELLQQFHTKLTETDVDVVYGIQLTRQDSRMNILTSSIFYRIFNTLSDYPIPKNLLTVRLMTQDYVRALLEHREKNFVISVLWEMTGYKQLPLAVEKSFKGQTTYNVARKLSHVVFAVTSTSSNPLLYIFYLGMLLTFTSGLFIIYTLIRYFFFRIGVDGFTSISISIWFFGGLNILAMGIISIYLSVIFAETKDRPYTIIKQVYERDSE
jgi:putative glycosyltransferase